MSSKNLHRHRFEVIEHAGQLPIIGVAYEHRMFDMKAVPNRLDFENAKDIAAFANSNGGIILVGAIEDTKTGYLTRYNPLTEQDAHAAQKRYEDANQNLCSPVPIIDTRLINIETGSVLAVTIWPFPGQAVGVRVISSKEEHGKQMTTWAFPMRQGTQTDYLRPEHTAMLMSPHTRSVSIALSRIPINVNLELHDQYLIDGTIRRNRSLSAELVDYSLLDNSVTLRVPRSGGEMANVFIPLERIDSVWQGSNSNYWQIAISGTVVFRREQPPFYSYHIAGS